jgi:AcrR family transcriptional regulator
MGKLEPGQRNVRAAIVKAAHALIVTRGFIRTTEVDVATKAKVSMEAFHHEFADMNAVLRQLSLAFVEQMVAVTDQSTRGGIWKGAAARDVVEVAVRSIIDVVLTQGELVREILAASARDPAFGEDLGKVGRHLSTRLVAVMSECTNEPLQPSRSLAFSLLLTTVSLAHHHVLVGDDWAGVTFTKQQLTEETARAVCAYLGLQPTIAIKEDDDDLAPTGMVEAIKTSEFVAARAKGRAERMR